MGIKRNSNLTVPVHFVQHRFLIAPRVANGSSRGRGGRMVDPTRGAR
jgi:hypothetical protein